jgi:hypothetical protein
MYWLEIDTGLNRRAVKLPSGELRIAITLMVKMLREECRKPQLCWYLKPFLFFSPGKSDLQ